MVWLELLMQIKIFDFNMCTLDLFLRALLFILLCLAVIRFFSVREPFHPWNKYGTVAIRYMPRHPTNTTRVEYDYVSVDYPFKQDKKSVPNPISPVTYRQIQSQKV